MDLLGVVASWCAERRGERFALGRAFCGAGVTGRDGRRALGVAAATGVDGGDKGHIMGVTASSSWGDGRQRRGDGVATA
jgi:hypothetical protein